MSDSQIDIPSPEEEAEALRLLREKAVKNSALLEEFCEHHRLLVSENNELKRAIEAHRSSFSWKITAPIRFVSRAVRAIIRRLLGR